MLDSILWFFKSVLTLTAVQVLWSFTFIIVFGLLLYIFSSRTRSIYYKAIGGKAELYITGFIGVPVHEIGHLIFCVLFRHRIDGVKLLDMNATNGVLGYVNHSYKKDSIYQNIGNFFIGVGPIIFSTIVLYVLLSLIVPELKTDIFSSLISNVYNSISMETFQLTDSSISSILMQELFRWKILFFSTIETTQKFLLSFTNMDYVSSISFWIFIYLSICISSHMELSPQDISHVTKAILIILVFMFFINSIWIFISSTNVFKYIMDKISIANYGYSLLGFLAILQSILIFALVISFVNFVVSVIVLNIVSYIKKRQFVGL